MTPERIAKQIEKRQNRRERNHRMKVANAALRQRQLIELGKTVIEVETKDEEGNVTKHYDFPPVPKFRGRSIHSLTWLSAKTSKQGISRKHRLDLKVEHTAAIVEDASRTFAKEVDKALAPEVVSSPEVTNADGQ